MFRLILAVIFLVAAIALISKGRWVLKQAVPARGSYGEAVPEQSFPLRGIGVGLIVIAGLLLAWASIYRLDIGEAAVIKPISGNVTESDSTAGFGLKAPWESVQKFSVRNQNISFFGETGGATFEDDKIQDIRITASTAENATAYIDMTMQYSITPGKVLDVYREYRTDARLKELAILPGVRGAVQIPPTTFATSEIKLQRPQLGQAMKVRIEQDLAKVGITIETISVRNISFEKSVQDSLDRVQAQKGETNAARERLNTSLISAEQVRVDAQAQSDADQIARCGATSVTKDVTINGLKTQQTIVTPVPAGQCQNRLNEQVLTSKYIDMLKEAAAKGNTVYVVPQGANNLLQLGQTK